MHCVPYHVTFYTNSPHSQIILQCIHAILHNFNLVQLWLDDHKQYTNDHTIQFGCGRIVELLHHSLLNCYTPLLWHHPNCCGMRMINNMHLSSPPEPPRLVPSRLCSSWMAAGWTLRRARCDDACKHHVLDTDSEYSYHSLFNVKCK